jgi:hypothetical protein
MLIPIELENEGADSNGPVAQGIFAIELACFLLKRLPKGVSK